MTTYYTQQGQGAKRGMKQFKTFLTPLENDALSQQYQTLPMPIVHTNDEPHRPVGTLYYGGYEEAEAWLTEEEAGAGAGAGAGVAGGNALFLQRTSLLMAFAQVLQKGRQKVKQARPPLRVPRTRTRTHTTSSKGTQQKRGVHVRVHVPLSAFIGPETFILAFCLIVFPIGGWVLFGQHANASDAGNTTGTTTTSGTIQQIQVTTVPEQFYQGTIATISLGKGLNGTIDTQNCFFTLTEQPTLNFLLVSPQGQCAILAKGQHVVIQAHTYNAHIEQVDTLLTKG